MANMVYVNLKDSMKGIIKYIHIRNMLQAGRDKLKLMVLSLDLCLLTSLITLTIHVNVMEVGEKKITLHFPHCPLGTKMSTTCIRIP